MSHSSLKWIVSDWQAMDILPDYAVIWSLDIHAIPPVILLDQEHLSQLQLDYPVNDKLLHYIKNIPNLKSDSQNDCWPSLF